MKRIAFLAPVAAAAFIAAQACAAGTALDPMPKDLEARFALSALPAALRKDATVYLLDPGKGYVLSRQGTSGLACLVERTVWEWAEHRDDVFIPLCYDAAGTASYLKVIMDTAAMRAQGMDAPALKTEIEGRYKSGTYAAPKKPGLSYMVAPVMRALGPPDMKMHTMSMPHLMIYAPGATNEDIGAKPDLAVAASLRYPFIDKQGNAEQSYMIQMLGATEKKQVLAEEQALLRDLCAYRHVLCLGGKGMQH